MMEYKGYRAEVHYDHEEDLFFGKVRCTRDIIIFEAASIGQLEIEFRFSVDDYLALCAEKGLKPDSQLVETPNMSVTSHQRNRVA